jgi:hypothetical protein
MSETYLSIEKLSVSEETFCSVEAGADALRPCFVNGCALLTLSFAFMNSCSSAQNEGTTQHAKTMLELGSTWWQMWVLKFLQFIY